MDEPHPTNRTVQLSTREFLGDRLRPRVLDLGPDDGIGRRLVGHWVDGSRAFDERPARPGPNAFRVERPLGHGALGEVLEVHLGGDPARPAALKLPLLPPQRTAASLENEIDKLGRLEHPHIPRLLATGRLDLHGLGPLPYLVIERLDPIGERFPESDQGRPIDPIYVARLFRALAGALAHLSTVGIVHNDVKPDNILLAGSRPVLVDWGTARSTTEINELEKDRAAGRLFGTPQWLPPEIVDVEGDSAEDAWIILHPDLIGQKTDVYGLGLVVLRLLTGRDLFDEPLGADVLRLFFRFHELMRTERLLERHLARSRRLLEETYVSGDPIAMARIADGDLRILYARGEHPTTGPIPRPTPQGVRRSPSTHRRRLARNRRPEPQPAAPRFAPLAARQALVEDLMTLVGACLAPFEERTKAPALVARIESTWPGLGPVR